jgi:hypothetical protein
MNRVSWETLVTWTILFAVFALNVVVGLVQWWGNAG